MIFNFLKKEFNVQELINARKENTCLKKKLAKNLTVVDNMKSQIESLKKQNKALLEETKELIDENFFMDTQNNLLIEEKEKIYNLLLNKEKRLEALSNKLNKIFKLSSNK